MRSKLPNLRCFQVEFATNEKEIDNKDNTKLSSILPGKNNMLVSHKRLFVTAALAATLLVVATLFFATESVAAAAAAAADDAAAPAADAAGVGAGGSTKAPKLRRPHRRSLFQACRSDILQTDCMAEAKKANDGTGAGRRAAITGTLDCLNRNIEKVKDKTCKEWLLARSACEKDAKDICNLDDSAAAKKQPDDAAAGGDDNEAGARMKPPRMAGPAMDPVTRCLMKADAAKLGEQCKNSDYYRSLVFQRMWRANRDKRIRANFDKITKKPLSGAGNNNAAEGGDAPAAPSKKEE